MANIHHNYYMILNNLPPIALDRSFAIILMSQSLLLFGVFLYHEQKAWQRGKEQIAITFE